MRQRACKVDIADQAILCAVLTRNPVDADIDHHRAGLDPIALDHLGAPDGCHDNVRPRDNAGEVARAAVRDGDGAIGIEQQLRHRLADDVRAPDDHRFEARQVTKSVLKQHQAAERSAWHKSAFADRELARIDDMEAIDVLVGIDRT